MKIRFNISLDARLLQELDRAAALEYSSRSDFIRWLVVRRLQELQKLTKPEATSNEELEAAYERLRKERAMRLSRAELPRIRHIGH